MRRSQQSRVRRSYTVGQESLKVPSLAVECYLQRHRFYFLGQPLLTLSFLRKQQKSGMIQLSQRFCLVRFEARGSP